MNVARIFFGLLLAAGALFGQTDLIVACEAVRASNTYSHSGSRGLP